MGRVYHLRPKKHPSAALLILSGIAPVGGLATFVSPSGPSVISQQIVGSIAPAGSVATAVSGPSFVTIPKSVDGTLNLSGDLLSEATGLGIVITRGDNGEIDPVGSVASEVSGPSYVTIEQPVSGEITPRSEIGAIIVATGGVVNSSVDGTITPASDLATAVSGPSYVTITQSVSGAITPAGVISDFTIGEVDINFDAPGSTGVLTPVGLVSTQVSGPSIVTITKSIGGTITPAPGVVTATLDPFTVTASQSVDGTITPAGSVVRQAGGPSYETVTKSVSGTITPVGDSGAAIVLKAKKKFAMNSSGIITPAGAVATSVSGPSIVTVFKSVSGAITPAGSESREAGGPSYVTITKSVGGGIVFTTVISNVVVPSPIIPKSVGGLITPFGVAALGQVVQVKSVAGVITPSGSTTRLNLTKSVAGSVGPSGSVAWSVGGEPIPVTQAVAGTITPAGSATALNMTKTKSISGQVSPVSALTKVVITPPLPGNPIKPGMFSVVRSLFDDPPHWLCTVYSPSPSGILTDISTARTYGGITIFARLSGGPASYSTIVNGKPTAFDLTKWKQQVDRFVGIINSSHADILVHYLIDEPNINNWYAGSLTPDILKQMCQYSKQKYPWLQTAIRAGDKHLAGSNLPSGGWSGSLDWGWAQYAWFTSKPETAAQYYAHNMSNLAAVGVGCVLGCNWIDGGDGSSGVQGLTSTRWLMTTTEIKTCFDEAYKYAANKWFPMWNYPTAGTSTDGYLVYYNQASYQNLWNYIVSKSASR